MARPETRLQAPVVMPEAMERNCPRCGATCSLYNGCTDCTYREGGGIWSGGPTAKDPMALRSPVNTSFLPDAVTGRGTFLHPDLNP